MVSHLTGDSSQSDRRQLIENSSQVYFLHNLSIFGKPVKILGNKTAISQTSKICCKEMHEEG